MTSYFTTKRSYDEFSVRPGIENLWESLVVPRVSLDYGVCNKIIRLLSCNRATISFEPKTFLTIINWILLLTIKLFANNIIFVVNNLQIAPINRQINRPSKRCTLPLQFQCYANDKNLEIL